MNSIVLSFDKSNNLYAAYLVNSAYNVASGKLEVKKFYLEQ